MKHHALRDGAVSFHFVGKRSRPELGELLESATGEDFVTHNHPATAKP